MQDIVSEQVAAYPWRVPRLWTDSIEAHRQAVRDATLDATASLVARNGLRSVTMAQIAEAAGIGRATLYKYFPDVDAILVAWHERQIASHLASFAALRDSPGSPRERLEAALQRYAEIQHQHHGSELATSSTAASTSHEPSTTSASCWKAY